MKVTSNGGLTIVRIKRKRRSGKVGTVVVRKSNLGEAIIKGKNNIIYG